MVADYLNLLWALSHAACTVLSPGYAGISMEGGRQIVYGGNCLDALSVAQSIGGQVLHLAQIVWPGP